MAFWVFHKLQYIYQIISMIFTFSMVAMIFILFIHELTLICAGFM